MFPLALHEISIGLKVPQPAILPSCLYSRFTVSDHTCPRP